MLKKLSLVLTMAVLSLPLQASNVFAQTDNAEKIKANVAAIGVGARVSIKLRDKKKLTGYVSQIGEADIVITIAKEGTQQTITYTDITEVKVKNEKRISTAGKFLIVFGVLALIGGISNGG